MERHLVFVAPVDEHNDEIILLFGFADDFTQARVVHAAENARELGGGAARIGVGIALQLCRRDDGDPHAARQIDHRMGSLFDIASRADASDSRAVQCVQRIQETAFAIVKGVIIGDPREIDAHLLELPHGARHRMKGEGLFRLRRAGIRVGELIVDHHDIDGPHPFEQRITHRLRYITVRGQDPVLHGVGCVKQDIAGEGHRHGIGLCRLHSSCEEILFHARKGIRLRVFSRFIRRLFCPVGRLFGILLISRITDCIPLRSGIRRGRRVCHRLTKRAGRLRRGSAHRFLRHIRFRETCLPCHQITVAGQGSESQQYHDHTGEEEDQKRFPDDMVVSVVFHAG